MSATEDPQHAHAQIETHNDEAELGAEDLQSYSDDGSSILSDTTSLSTSVSDYQYENGRRYHAYHGGKYVLPNDEKEQDRLDQMHHLWLLLLGGDLYKAPIEHCTTKKCLDLGTGTGSWAIDFGDMHPDWEVTGTDLSPIQPSWVPENVKFEVDDFEEDWTWKPESFGMIHVRNLMGAVSSWEAFLKKVYDHLEPNGFLELHESDVGNFFCDDGTLDPNNSGWKTYYEHMNGGANKINRRFDWAPKLPELIAAAGFTDINVGYVKCPVGPWAKDRRKKEMGMWGSSVMQTGAEAYALAMITRVLGKSEKEAKKIIDDLLADVNNPKKHVYIRQYYMHARKPCGTSKEASPATE